LNRLGQIPPFRNKAVFIPKTYESKMAAAIGHMGDFAGLEVDNRSIPFWEVQCSAEVNDSQACRMQPSERVDADGNSEICDWYERPLAKLIAFFETTSQVGNQLEDSSSPAR
jgi:hypothetical protein